MSDKLSNLAFSPKFQGSRTNPRVLEPPQVCYNDKMHLYENGANLPLHVRQI